MMIKASAATPTPLFQCLVIYRAACHLADLCFHARNCGDSAIRVFKKLAASRLSNSNKPGAFDGFCEFLSGNRRKLRHAPRLSQMTQDLTLAESSHAALSDARDRAPSHRASFRVLSLLSSPTYVSQQEPAHRHESRLRPAR